MKDDKTKLQEQVEKKEEIINLLINVWNNKKNSNSIQNNEDQSLPSKPQIRNSKIPELKKTQSIPISKEKHILMEEKLRNIDSKIVNARQKSLLLKNEKVHKLKEEYLKRVEELNSKKTPQKIYGVPPLSQIRGTVRQYNSVPPKTTDNSYQRITSMREIQDESYPPMTLQDESNNNDIIPARVLKTSTPYKTNAKMFSQMRDKLVEDDRDFNDINSFRMVGNYLNNSLEFKEKKIIQLNLEKNLANLKFTNDNLTNESQKKPMFPIIKSSIELKSRSEFMRLDHLLNKTDDELYGDFRLTPNESKKLVLPSAHLENSEDNEFFGLGIDFLHLKTPTLDGKNEILVVDHNNNTGNLKNGVNNNNEIFNPYTTVTSVNTINTTAISKQRFPRDIFNPSLKKKIII